MRERKERDPYETYTRRRQDENVRLKHRIKELEFDLDEARATILRLRRENDHLLESQAKPSAQPTVMRRLSSSRA